MGIQPSENSFCVSELGIMGYWGRKNMKQNKKTVSIVVALIFLVSFVGSYPQYQLSPIAYKIIPELQLSNAQFSAVFSAPMIPGILLSLAAGILSDKFGVKRCIGIAGVISLVGVTLRIFWGTSSFTGLFVCMLLSGIVASFNNANFGKIMGSWFPPEKVGMMVGIVSAGSTCAMALAMSTTALLPSVKSAYTLAAVISAVITVLFLVFMKEKTDEIPSGEKKEEKISLADCVKVGLKNKFVWIVGLGLGLIFIPSICLSSFLPTALSEVRGIDAAAAGSVSSVIMFGNLFGGFLGPVIAAKVGKMKPVLIGFAVISAAGTAFGWLAPTGIPMILVLFLTGFACSTCVSLLLAAPVLLPGIGPVYAGTAGGLCATMELLIGVIVSSYIIAPAIGANYQLLYVTAGILGGVGALLLTRLPELYGRQ